MDNNNEIIRLTEELKARDEEINRLKHEVASLQPVQTTDTPPVDQDKNKAELQRCQKKIATYEELHEKWRGISNKLSPGNVRAEKLRQMLAEIDQIKAAESENPSP